MATVKRQSGPTRARILEAACRLFAERGYRGTTVALICRTARVNIAAVNYHFGGKENLYRLAWRHAHDRVQKRIPYDGEVPADRPPQQRLGGRIRAFLRRAQGGDFVEFGIIRKEMANPTGLLRQVIDDAIAPVRQATQAILRELLGPRASEMDVELCEHYLVAPLLQVVHWRQAEKHPGPAPVFGEDKIEAMADHFLVFALAGIREIRRRIEAVAGPADQQEQ